MQLRKTEDLTSGSVLRVLLRFSLPYMLSSFLQMLYSAVDMFVVGRYADTAAISAVSVGGKISSLITVVIMGLSTGATVLIGNRVGERDGPAASAAIGNTISLFAMIAAVITPMMIVLTPAAVRLVQTPQAAVGDANTYVLICACGLPFITAYNLACCILRAIGDSRTPVRFILIACLVNVALDFLLVGCFSLGVGGAAAATVAAQSVAAVSAVVYLLRHRAAYAFSRRDLKPHRAEMGRILKVGLPVAVQDGCLHVYFIILTVIANSRGLTDSAGVGIVETIMNFVFLVSFSVESALVTITAQNIGAGKPQRACRSTYYAVLIAGGFGVLMALLCQLFSVRFVALFTMDAQVAAAGAAYLRTYSIDTAIGGAVICVNGYLCGKGSSGIVFLQNILSIVLVRLPVAYFMSMLHPESMAYMGASSPAGSAFSMVFLALYLFIKKDLLISPHGR